MTTYAYPSGGPSTYADPLSMPPVVTVAAGVFRLGPDGVYIHDNISHAAIGIERIYINTSGELAVDHVQVGRVCSIVAQADETLAERGIAVGPSGGGSQTRLRFGYPGKPGTRLRLDWPSHYDLVASDVSNVWFEVRQVQDGGAS